jgi:murein DD-endopeptidase MepM/ murein hydrolase activator NlpD
VFPLETGGHIIGRPYDGTHAKSFNRRGGTDNWESENAIDYATPKGSPVYAVADGQIGGKIGSLGSGGRFAGLRLHLVTGNNEFYYAHLSRLTVQAGEHVRAGQLIGYSGVANGVAHLHIAALNGNPLQLFTNPVYVENGKAPQLTDTSSAPPDITETTAPPDTTQPQGQQIEPVGAPALPTDLPLPQAGQEMPGSVHLVPHRLAALWSSLPQDDLVSPDTQRLVQNAQLAGG